MKQTAARIMLILQLSIFLCVVSAAQNDAASKSSPSPRRQLDHTVYNLPSLEKQLTELEKTKGKEDAALIPVLEEIGKAYREQGGYLPAMPLLERALAIARKSSGENSTDVAGAADYLGTLNLLAGDYGAALENYELARSILEKTMGKDGPPYLMEMQNIGVVYLRQGKLSEAETTLLNSENALSKLIGPAAPELTGCQGALGEVYLRKGNLTRAASQLQYALAVLSEGLELRPEGMTEADVKEMMAPMQNVLGAVYTTASFYDRAGDLLGESLKNYEAKRGHSHESLEAVPINLSALSEAEKYKGDAAGARERAESIHRENIGFAHAASVPLPPPLKPDVMRESKGSLANGQAGDWVSYSGPDGEPARKMEIAKSSPAAAIVVTSDWDGAAKKWMAGPEQLMSKASNLYELWDLDEAKAKPEKLEIKGKQLDVSCTLMPPDANNMQCKMCVSDEIPAGGMAKIECDGKVLMKATDYKRGK